MKYCSVCDRKYPDTSRVCEHDGVTLKTTESADPFIGKTIKGKYRVLKKLGAGGMGAIYLAEQTSIGRKVALKMLHREFAADDEFVKRFHQEARLAASFSHRHVITIHDFDQAEDGSLFIAMEYVQGKNLKTLIREGPLQLGRAVRLGRQIAEGLSAAHRSGIIHRDIKPENIMIIEGTEEVKLMDFGISRLRDAETLSRLTRPGMIMGTPAYMAPEQIEGSEVDNKTDIYAFGVVLYEMLSGEGPFKAPTPTALLMKHVNEVPVPLRKLRNDIPPAIEHVVMQALEKKPERRQREMEEVVCHLRSVEETIKDDTPPTVIIAAPGFEKKHRRVVAGVLLFATVAAFILVIGREDYGQLPWFTSPVSMHSLLVQASKTDLELGESASLRARAHYIDGTEKEVRQGLQWVSSNPSVAAVSADGQIQARQQGETEIIARLGDLAARSVKLTVKGSPIAPLPAHVISLIGHDYPRTLQVNERRALSVIAKFSDGAERNINEGLEWKSSDATVLNISANGEVEALKAGRATVSVTYQAFKSEPISIEVRGKSAKAPRVRTRANDTRQADPSDALAARSPPSANQTPANLIPAPSALSSENIVQSQPPPVKRASEAETVLTPEASKVITDYISGEMQRRNKSRR